jgi:hypothetical protein
MLQTKQNKTKQKHTQYKDNQNLKFYEINRPLNPGQGDFVV